MGQARFLLAALIVAGAVLAACSGNFGAGTTQPGQVIPSGPLNPSTPTPTPNSANAIVTYGETDALQPLPSVGGYGGAIAFSVPSPKPSGFDDIPIGVTMSVLAPSDSPNLNTEVSRGRKTKRRERPARALIYISLLPTRDLTLSTYPRFAIDVPRDIVTVYRETELGIAYYNSGEKAKTYRLAVAAVESSTTAPAPASSASAAASTAPGSAPPATPSPTPSPSPSPSPTEGGRRGGPPGAPQTPTPVPTLPPQRITFAAASGPVKLYANKPAIFALYALPVEATPAPSAKPSGAARPRAASSASAAPTAAGSASPSAFASEVPLSTSTVVAPAAPSAPSAPVPPAVTTTAAPR